MNETGIRWSSRTIRVDVDTGDILTKTDAEKNYIKIKTTKHGETNRNKTRGTIEWTILYRKNNQGRIFEH